MDKERVLEILEIEVKPYLPKGHWGSVKNLILNITEDEPKIKRGKPSSMEDIVMEYPAQQENSDGTS